MGGAARVWTALAEQVREREKETRGNKMVMKHSEREREEKREKNKKMVRKQRELSALCLFVCLFVCCLCVFPAC